jgi:hypothetical protein
MFENVTTYSNDTAREQIAWMEPWCEEIRIPPDKTFSFKGRGAEPGEIEIEKRDEGIIVYGWPTSVVEVECDGQTIWKAYSECPQIPPGTTMSAFVKFLFRQKPVEN